MGPCDLILSYKSCLLFYRIGNILLLLLLAGQGTLPLQGAHQPDQDTEPRPEEDPTGPEDQGPGPHKA